MIYEMKLGMPCNCATMVTNEQTGFTFALDKTKVTENDVGTWKVVVEVTDSEFPVSQLMNTYSFDVEITFIPLVFIEQPELLEIELEGNSTD